MTDFPGGMKEKMPAWRQGERCEEGLKINEELLIEEWRNERSLSGKITESWKKNGYQFFISTCEPERFVFMGVLCSKNDDGSFKIAKKVEEDYNRIDKLPCFSGICAKKITAGTSKEIALLSTVRKIIYTRKENKETEERLIKAVEEFEKEKQNMPKSD